jgi:hypothetical protein
MLKLAKRVSVLITTWFLLACTTSIQASNWISIFPNPTTDEVMIHAHYVQVPQGRILLVRKDSECCAVKFTRFWRGKTEEDYLGSYERYYQSDGSADFTKPNVVFQTDDVSYPRFQGIDPFIFQIGKKYLRCGSIQLIWLGNGKVTFITPDQHIPRDVGVEIAPTPWISITEANTHDSRIKWYRLAPDRKRAIISIDHLWNQTAVLEQ